MGDAQTLIPSPPVVRDRLARNIREGRLLRALLRLSIRAAEERHRSQAGCLAQVVVPDNIPHEPHLTAAGREVGHDA
jgi:hypothetical protein